MIPTDDEKEKEGEIGGKMDVDSGYCSERTNVNRLGELAQQDCDTEVDEFGDATRKYKHCYDHTYSGL